MPSLSSPVIAGLFNGAIPNWERIHAPDSTGVEVSLDDAVSSRISAGLCPGYNAAAYPVPTDTRVRVCRRPPSAFTTIQFRVNVSRALCIADAQDILGDNTPFSDTTTDAFTNWQNTVPVIPNAPAIIETSASSDMGHCLRAFSDDMNPATQRWAIGIQPASINANLQHQYRLIKVDGVASTPANVIRNRYLHWVESLWAWRANGDENAIDVMTTLATRIGAAENFVGSVDLIALNTVAGNVPSIPVNPGNPVATSTHASGGTLESCRIPYVNSRVTRPW